MTTNHTRHPENTRPTPITRVQFIGRYGKTPEQVLTGTTEVWEPLEHCKLCTVPAQKLHFQVEDMHICVSCAQRALAQARIILQEPIQ